MSKSTKIWILLGIATGSIAIVWAVMSFDISAGSRLNNIPDIELPPQIQASSQHPIIGKEKREISRLFPGNCFSEIYLSNPSFNGNLVESCKKKSTEQIKAITGMTISPEELTSPDVRAYLKQVYGQGNPWRS